MSFLPRSVFLFGLVLMLSVSFLSSSVSASINNATPEEETRSTSYYRTLGRCISNNMFGDIQQAASDNGNANPSNWFDGNRAFGYIYPDGKKDCKDIVQPALQLWGWGTDYNQFLRDIGYTYNSNEVRWNGTPNGDQRRAAFESAVQKKYYQINFSGNPVQSQEARYLMFLNAFQKACQGKSLGLVSTITNSSYTSWLNQSSLESGFEVRSSLAGIKPFNDNTSRSYAELTYFTKLPILEKSSTGEYSLKEYGYAYANAIDVATNNWNGELIGANGVKIYGYHDDAVIRDCQEIQKGVKENASAFLRWVVTEAPENFELSDNLSGGNVIDTDEESEGESACAVEGVGWIVCPALTFMATLTDGAFEIIEGFLRVSPELLSTESGTYTLWNYMRNFANVAFVIVFLIIIFSQLSSIGVTNYGVKKTLPRLIVAAILVNVSFFVVQIAVDLSNIIGSSLYELFRSIPTAPPGTEDASGNAGGWIVTIALALAAGGAAILAISAPVLLAALLAVLAILLILMARFALIVLLTAIAPLAFVAMMLPNTEGLFKKWLNLLTSLLVLYPIVAVVFGASYVASQVIANAGAAASGGGFGDIDGELLQVTALGVAAIPLILVPSILRGSLKAAGGLGAKLSSLSTKASGGVGTKVKSTSRLGEAQRGLGQRMALARAQRRTDSRFSRAIDQSRVGRALGFDRGAAAASAAVSGAEAELIKNADSRLDMMSVDSQPLSQAQMMQIALGQDVTDASGKVAHRAGSFDESTRRAAIQRAARIATVKEAHQLVDASGSMSIGERKTLSSSLASSSVLTKAPYLSGKTLGLIEQGSAKSDVAAKSAIADGKITAEALASTDKDSADFLLQQAMATPFGSVERARLKAAYAQLTAPDSKLREKIVTGSDHDTILSAMASL